MIVLARPLCSIRATGYRLNASPLRSVGRRMSVNNEQPATIGKDGAKFRWRRLIPLIVLACVSLAVFAMGWHRQLSFGNLLRHHDELRSFIAAHEAGALAAYVALYIAAGALSVPVGAYITLAG